jgi:peptide/nickel transport system substrate-binding protein
MHLKSLFAFRRLVGSAAILAALAACSSGPAPALTPPPPASPSPAQSSTAAPSAQVPPGTATRAPLLKGGSIVIAGIGQPSREVTSLPRFLSDALYDSLLQIGPADGSLKPGLAESWQVSDDARAFTFHLRAGVRWHDGQPLTAQDVVFTIKSLSAPDVRITPAADFGPLADVTAPDSQTVSVRLKDAYCPALTSIGTLKILPAHILGTPHSSQDKAGQTGLTSLAAAQFVGSGPLVLQDWNADAITFTPNANYWNGAPPIADWTYRIFASVADAQAALKAGQVDLVSLEAGQAVGSSSAADAKIYAYPSNQFYAMAINLERDIFADARMRQALALALNRRGLAEGLFGKDAQTLQTSILPGFWASPTNAVQPAYDPALARQLLAEAGWSDTDGDGILDKDGKPLSVTLWAVADDPIGEPLVFDVRRMLAQVGVQVLLQLDDRDELLTRVFLHEFDLALAPWNIPLDPDQHWYWQSNENKQGEGFNIVSYANPQVDDLLKRGNLAPECDPNARRAIYAQAYRTISNDVPQVFLFAPPVFLEARPRVFGLAPSPFAGAYWNINSWQVGP